MSGVTLATVNTDLHLRGRGHRVILKVLPVLLMLVLLMLVLLMLVLLVTSTVCARLCASVAS